jgi:hypothetical protein
MSANPPVLFTYPAAARGKYWPDVFLRCEIPALWLEAQGVQVSVVPFTGSVDLAETLDAHPAARIAVRVGGADVPFAQSLIGRRFTLLPEMPARHMHRLDGGPVPPERHPALAWIIHER